jgi:hypothetical protein
LQLHDITSPANNATNTCRPNFRSPSVIEVHFRLVLASTGDERFLLQRSRRWPWDKVYCRRSSHVQTTCSPCRIPDLSRGGSLAGVNVMSRGSMPHTPDRRKMDCRPRVAAQPQPSVSDPQWQKRTSKRSRIKLQLKSPAKRSGRVLDMMGKACRHSVATTQAVPRLRHGVLSDYRLMKLVVVGSRGHCSRGTVGRNRRRAECAPERRWISLPMIAFG